MHGSDKQSQNPSLASWGSGAARQVFRSPGSGSGNETEAWAPELALTQDGLGALWHLVTCLSISLRSFDLIVHLVILDKICVYQMDKMAYIIELLLLVGLCVCVCVFLGNGNPFHYSCLGNPWTEEPHWLQSMGSQRVEHDWATIYRYMYIYICVFRGVKLKVLVTQSCPTLRPHGLYSASFLCHLER